MRKGISLPINTIIIIIVCFLVLLAIIMFFTGTFSPAANTTKTESELRNECWKWQRTLYTDTLSSTEYPLLNTTFNNITEAKRYCTGIEE